MQNPDPQFEILKIVLDKGLLALLAVLVGFWLKSREERWLFTRERRFVPRTELDLQCAFHGPEQDDVIVAVSLIVDNKAGTRRTFRSMEITMRGIRRGAALSLWAGMGKHRLDFPVPLVKEELVPPARADETNYYFVEPGVKQVFSFFTKIPAEIGYVRIHAKLRAILEDQADGAEDEFTEERLFVVDPASTTPGREPRRTRRR